MLFTGLPIEPSLPSFALLTGFVASSFKLSKRSILEFVDTILAVNEFPVIKILPYTIGEGRGGVALANYFYGTI